MAAEYVLKEGNPNVMLCERGIRTFETAYRFTLDIMAVPVLKELTHLPVIVDPSHAAGRRDLVLPLSLAAAAAGADGIIVEVHPNPEEAICDGPQQLYADELRRLPRAGRAGGGGRRQGALRASGRVTTVAVVGVGPDRRLDRARRARAARRATCAASTRGGGVRDARARARRGRPTACGSVAEARRRAPTSRSSPRRCGVLPGVGRARCSRPRATGLRGHRRRLDQARGRGARSTTRASSAGTRWRAPRPRASSTRARTCSRTRPGT